MPITRVLVLCSLLLGLQLLLAAVPLSYTLPRDGRVSLAVYDANGRMVRTLLNAEPQTKGANTLQWDGLDGDGKPVAPGNYTWKLLLSPGLQAEYLLSLGTSFGHQAWPAQHGGIAAIACDGQGLYATSGSSEGSPQTVKITLDGQYEWASPTLEGWDNGHDLAIAGSNLYFLSGNGSSHKTTLHTQLAATGEVIRSWRLDEKFNRVAVREKVLVIGATDGTVSWLNSATGAVLDTTKLPAAAADLAVTADGTVLALCGSELLAFTQAEKTPQVRLTGLTAPRRLDVDPVSGEIFIAEGGASQQVKRYSPQFALQQTYGRAGGRAEGLYKPEDFLEISDVCGDGRGGFVVSESESAPRRTAHFAKDGHLLQVWYGGQQFYTFPAPDPGNPNWVWLDSHWGWVMQCEVDWAKRTWKPRACYRWGGDTSPHLVSRYKMAMPHWVLRRDMDGDGKTEVYLRSGSHTALLQKVDEQAGRLRPVALLSLLIGDDRWGWNKVPAEQLPAPFMDAIRLLKEDPMNPGVRSKHRGFAWADANGDFDFQPEEFRLFTSAVEHMGMNLWMDEALNVYAMRGWDTMKKPIWVKYPVQGYTKAGAPIWDWTKFVDGPVTPYASLQALQTDAQGGVYAVGMGGAGDGYVAKGTYGEGHAFAWPANQTDSNAVMKFDAQGNLLWKSGFHAPRRPNLPAQLHYPIRIAGMVKGCIGVCDKIAQPVVFWTEEGLYAGSLFDRRAADGLPDAVYSWWTTDPSARSFQAQSPFQYDMLEGGSLLTLANGDVIYVGAGWNNCPAYRITGWDGFVRQTGAVKVAAAPPPASAAGTGLLGSWYAADSFAGEPVKEEPREVVRYDEKWPAGIDTAKPWAVRWCGLLEAKFTEPTTLGVYAAGGYRLWVGGKLLLDQWGNGGKGFTEPLRFTAGQKYPITLEWHRTGNNPTAHLVWESASQQIEHIPAAYLFPEEDVATAPVLSVEGTQVLTNRGATYPQPAVVTILRTGPTTKPLTLLLSTGGSAVPGVDYQPLPATVTIPAGKASLTVPIVPIPGTTPRPPLAMTLSLGVSAAYRLDGTAGKVQIGIADRRRTPIAGVKAVASDSPEQAQAMVDGSGMNLETAPAQHSNNPAQQWHAFKPYKDGKPWLLFDLGAVYELSSIRLYNYNLQPGDKSVGIKDVDIYVSETTHDALVRWKSMTFPIASGRPDYPGTEIAFPVRARYIKIGINSIHDYPWDTPLVQAGVAEILFFGERK